MIAYRYHISGSTHFIKDSLSNRYMRQIRKRLHLGCRREDSGLNINPLIRNQILCMLCLQTGGQYTKQIEPDRHQVNQEERNHSPGI